MRSVVERFRGSSVRVFGLDRERVLARLRGRARSLVEADPNVLEVRLFGSLARRDAGPGSDADLLIIVESCTLPVLERAPGYARNFEGAGVGCDVVVYTRSEKESAEARHTRFMRTVDAEGLTLAGRT